MRTRSMAKGLLLSCTALMAFVVLMELVLQVLLPLVYRPRFTRVDAELGWYHNASVSTTASLEGHEYFESYNSHGYRSPEHDFDKPAGVTRVAMLGDSFVDGSEVGDEELLTWHLEQALSGVEVINLGVYGYSTAQQLITLERVALRYVPDLVVLVTVPNDLSGNAHNLSYFGPAPRFVLDGDSLRYEPTTSEPAQAAFRATNLPVPGMSLLHENSLVYHLLNHMIYQPLIATRIQGLLDQQSKSLSREEKVELYHRLVSRMKQICDERGVQLLVVLGYEKHELRTAQPSPHADIASRLEAEGIATLDLHDALRDAEAAGNGSLYYEHDIHWNVRGHRFMAEAIRPRVEQWLGERQAMIARSRRRTEGTPGVTR